jgi:hypothetical protein
MSKEGFGVMTIRFRHTVVRVLTAFVLLLGGGIAAAAPASRPVLENAGLRLAFQPDGGGLTELSSKSMAFDYLAEGGSHDLWGITPIVGEQIGPERASSFAWEPLTNGTAGLKLVWSRFNLKDIPDLQIIATVTLDPVREETRWRIRLEGLGGMRVRVVSFPQLCGLAPQVEEALAVPAWMGQLTRKPRALFNPEGGGAKRREWEYPGLLSMQCLAWYSGAGPGLLLATHDTESLRKEFAVFGDGEGGVGMEVLHLPPSGEVKQDLYEPAYETVTSTFRGGWYAAAQEYGRWGREQCWVRESRLKQNKTQDWVRDTGLWVWNRGRSEKVLDPALCLQEMSHLPVSVFWHWWHGCAYDAGFPEYLPPREGEAPFRVAMAAAHEKGIHSLVYMNQRLWGMTTTSWIEEGAERYAVKGPDRKVAPEVYNTFMKVPCASMCMGTAFWREKYAGLAEAVLNLGVDGIYMDQACSSLSCYDPSHGHPLGGGSYWMEGFQSLEADIRRRCESSHPVTLAGEGCGEAWLPHLDLMLSLQVSLERYSVPGEWEPIPFFHAVYHDCVLLYGNYSSLTYPPYDELWPAESAPKEPFKLLDRKFATQFRLEQARAFVWGQQPTLANFTPRLLEERQEEITFLLRLSRLRHEAREFLQDGLMLAPLAFEAPEAEIPISRLSIYAGQQDAVREYAKTVPLVLSGVWRAPDGRVAVALVNISEQNQPVEFRMERKDYPISEAGSIECITSEGRSDLGRYSMGKAAVILSLNPASGCLIKFTPAP